jgi:hypothetical protein
MEPGVLENDPQSTHKPNHKCGFLEPQLERYSPRYIGWVQWSIMDQCFYYLQGALPDLIYGGCSATLFVTQ